MALKPGLPAMRAESVWQWLKRGSLHAGPLYNTRVLLITENSQPVAGGIRYWLGRGVLLVPKWIKYTGSENVSELDDAVLHQRGMYRQQDGLMVMLIYQHVEDVLHLQRQQWHVYEGFRPTGKEITELTDIEKVAAGNEKHVARIVWQASERERAADSLLVSMRNVLNSAIGGLAWVLDNKATARFLAGEEPSLELVSRALAMTCKNLNHLRGVRPVGRLVSLAQGHLRGAIGSLHVGDAAEFSRAMLFAKGALVQARAAMDQPEKEEALKPAA